MSIKGEIGNRNLRETRCTINQICRSIQPGWKYLADKIKKEAETYIDIITQYGQFDSIMGDYYLVQARMYQDVWNCMSMKKSTKMQSYRMISCLKPSTNILIGNGSFETNLQALMASDPRVNVTKNTVEYAQLDEIFTELHGMIDPRLYYSGEFNFI